MFEEFRNQRQMQPQTSFKLQTNHSVRVLPFFQVAISKLYDSGRLSDTWSVFEEFRKQRQMPEWMPASKYWDGAHDGKTGFFPTYGHRVRDSAAKRAFEQVNN